MKKALFPILLLALLLASSGCNQASEESTKRSKKTKKTTEATEDTSEPSESDPDDTSSEPSDSEPTDTIDPYATDPYDPDPSDPAAHSMDTSGDVAVDWSRYETQVTIPDPIYTRIDDEYIDDFTPSTEYGWISAFYNGDSTAYGFYDIHGQVICDAVFSYLVDNANYSYSYSYSPGQFKYFIVGTKAPVTVGDETAHPFMDKTIGLISGDGSKYTGLLYNDYFYTAGSLTLIKIYDDHITADEFDLETFTVSDSYDLKMDLSSVSSYATIGRIIDERYILLYTEYWEDESDPEWLTIIDGKTGEKIPVPEDADVVGSMLVSYPEYSSDIVFSSLDGATSWSVDSNDYNIVNYGDELTDKFLLCHGLDYELRDQNGNILKTWNLTQDDYMYTDVNQITVRHGAGIEIYDADLNLIHACDLENDYGLKISDGSYVFFNYPDDVWKSYNYDSDVPVAFISDEYTQKRTMVNLENGNTLEFPTSADYVIMDDVVLLTPYVDTSTGTSIDWSLLDIRDFHVITSGLTPNGVGLRKDAVTGDVYAIVSDDSMNESITILDAATGETFTQLHLFPGAYNFITQIYDGTFFCTSHISDLGDAITNVFSIIDKDGETKFLLTTSEIFADRQYFYDYYDELENGTIDYNDI